MFVNPLARAIQPALIFNFVKTIDVLWNPNARTTKTVTLTSSVLLIQMEDHNVNQFAVEDFYVEETRIVSPEIMLLSVNANKDSMLMERFAEKLSVKLIMIVAMTNVVKTTCAKLFA